MPRLLIKKNEIFWFWHEFKNQFDVSSLGSRVRWESFQGFQDL